MERLTAIIRRIFTALVVAVLLLLIVFPLAFIGAMTMIIRHPDSPTVLWSLWMSGFRPPA